jgi:hypothetical protein
VSVGVAGDLEFGRAGSRQVSGAILEDVDADEPGAAAVELADGFEAEGDVDGAEFAFGADRPAAAALDRLTSSPAPRCSAASPRTGRQWRSSSPWETICVVNLAAAARGITAAPPLLTAVM